MDNLEAVLKAHGSSLAHTVKFNIYIIDYKDFADQRALHPPHAHSCPGPLLHRCRQPPPRH